MDVESESIQAPYMCGKCHGQFTSMELFDQHLQTHYISSQPLVCPDTETRTTEDRRIQCKLCNSEFKTVSTFHDHLINCESSGSYIFHYQTFQAYPLSDFCAFFESRQFRDRRSENQINDLDLNKTKAILNDYVDALNDLFHEERSLNKEGKSDHSAPIVCEAATQTSATDNDKEQVLNSNQTTYVGKSKNIAKKKTQGKELTAHKSKIKQMLVKTRARCQKTGETEKRKRGRKRKHIMDQDVGLSNLNKSCHEESIELILIKTETQDQSESISKQQQEKQNISETVTENSTIGIDEIKLEEEDKDSLKSLTEMTDSDSTIVSPYKKTRGKRKKTTYEADGSDTSDYEHVPVKRKAKGLIACDVCGKEVKSYSMLHHKRSHSNVRDFACDQCPKTYKHKSHLAIHKKKHLATLPYYCEICGRGFTLPSALKTHQMCHKDNNERQFKCAICGFGFLFQASLDRHMIKHTGDKKIQCDLCGARFMQNHNLKSHISRVHRKERNFPCAECDEKFLTSYQLKCHILRHRGLRPYKCILCGADYVERKSLRKHMKTVHAVSLEEVMTTDSMDKVIAEAIKREEKIPSDPNNEGTINSKPLTENDNRIIQSVVVLPVFPTDENQSAVERISLEMDKTLSTSHSAKLPD